MTQFYDARTLHEVIVEIDQSIRKARACNWSCTADEAWTGNEVRDEVIEELTRLRRELSGWAAAASRATSDRNSG